MADDPYDIAVIGGGLAGLCLSIQLAVEGYSVVLFERDTYPFHKVCGEYISLESKPFLQLLGLQLDDWNLPTINKLETSDCDGNTYSFNLPLGGFGISRFQLDDKLYKLALAKGVVVLTDTKVNEVTLNQEQFEIITSKGNYTSTIAAGCYGKRSNIDVKLSRKFVKQKPNKLNNYIGIKYHIKYNHSADTIALHNFRNGYGGMSRIEEDKSCLCYLTTAENLACNNNSVQQMEKNVLQKNKVLKSIFEEAEFLFDQPLAISQISFDKKAQVENHLLMVGDAAGLITPLCGNGMSMAMHASKLASQVIHLFLQKKISRAQMEKMYTQNWATQFSNRLFAGRIVQSMFGNSFTTSIFLQSLRAFPFVAKQVIKSTHGKPF
jgi:flavin-dependent dehydrogenase